MAGRKIDGQFWKLYKRKMYKRKVDKMKDGHTERWRKKHNVGQKEREKPDSTNVEINRKKMSLRRILVCCIKTCKKDWQRKNTNAGFLAYFPCVTALSCVCILPAKTILCALKHDKSA